MAGFIGVHVGAGNYSESLTKNYKKLCRMACREGTAKLLSGGSCLDAATAATVVLESSDLTNAGYGSNLNIDGNVEVDAGVMEGKHLTFGGVGAVPGVCHPVIVANEICKNQLKVSSKTHGLIPPSIIVGRGATTWAEKAGLNQALSSDLVSDRAKKQFRRNMKKLEKCKKHTDEEVCVRVVEENPLDTVGVVAIDSQGNVVATCSSGGISLKSAGRVGQAAIFGAGCWAENAKEIECEREQEAIAVCTTGCGEYLIRTSLARELAHSVLYSEGSGTVPLYSAFTEKFLRSPFVAQVDEFRRLGGAIILRAIGHSGHLEFLWAHSTKSMCIGYSIAKADSKPKSHISVLPPGSAAGSKVVVEGVSLQIGSSRF